MVGSYLNISELKHQQETLELHNGSIRLESEINVGAKAIFTLPLAGKAV